MENQNIINLLHDKTNQPSKLRTRNQVEINDDSRGAYDDDNNNDDNIITLKLKLIRSSLIDYIDAYTLAKGIITVPNPAGDAAVNNTNKRVISENYAPCTDCMTKINNTEVDNAEDIDIVVSIYNLIEYSDAYSKASESLWRYYRDEPALDNNNNIADFHAADNNSHSFKFQQKITGQTENSETKDVEVMLPLKYLSNF